MFNVGTTIEGCQHKAESSFRDWPTAILYKYIVLVYITYVSSTYTVYMFLIAAICISNLQAGKQESISAA